MPVFQDFWTAHVQANVSTWQLLENLPGLWNEFLRCDPATLLEVEALRDCEPGEQHKTLDWLVAQTGLPKALLAAHLAGVDDFAGWDVLRHEQAQLPGVCAHLRDVRTEGRQPLARLMVVLIRNIEQPGIADTPFLRDNSALRTHAVRIMDILRSVLGLDFGVSLRLAFLGLSGRWADHLTGAAAAAFSLAALLVPWPCPMWTWTRPLLLVLAGLLLLAWLVLWMREARAIRRNASRLADMLTCSRIHLLRWKEETSSIVDDSYSLPLALACLFGGLGSIRSQFPAGLFWTKVLQWFERNDRRFSATGGLGEEGVITKVGLIPQKVADAVKAGMSFMALPVEGGPVAHEFEKELTFLRRPDFVQLVAELGAGGRGAGWCNALARVAALAGIAWFLHADFSGAKAPLLADFRPHEEIRHGQPRTYGGYSSGDDNAGMLEILDPDPLRGTILQIGYYAGTNEEGSGIFFHLPKNFNLTPRDILSLWMRQDPTTPNTTTSVRLRLSIPGKGEGRRSIMDIHGLTTEWQRFDFCVCDFEKVPGADGQWENRPLELAISFPKSIITHTEGRLYVDEPRILRP